MTDEKRNIIIYHTTDGKAKVSLHAKEYRFAFYSPEMIFAIGFRVRSKRDTNYQ